MGWEVRPSVSVSQNEERSQVLHQIMELFGCGTIRRDPSDLTVKWEVRSLQQLRGKVLPHFEEWPLLSGKQADVELLVAVCDLMAKRQHLQPEGLIEIVNMARRMNPSGKRRFDPDVIMDQLNEMKA